MKWGEVGRYKRGLGTILWLPDVKRIFVIFLHYQCCVVSCSVAICVCFSGVGTGTVCWITVHSVRGGGEGVGGGDDARRQ